MFYVVTLANGKKQYIFWRLVLNDFIYFYVVSQLIKNLLW